MHASISSTASYMSPKLQQFARNHRTTSSEQLLDEIEGMFDSNIEHSKDVAAERAAASVSFDSIDANNDGVLSREEWENWQHSIRHPSGPSTARTNREGSLSQRLFQELEANGGKLSGPAVQRLSHSVDSLEAGIREQQRSWAGEKSEMQSRMDELLREVPPPPASIQIQAHTSANLKNGKKNPERFSNNRKNRSCRALN